MMLMVPVIPISGLASTCRQDIAWSTFHTGWANVMNTGALHSLWTGAVAAQQLSKKQGLLRVLGKGQISS